MLKNSLSINAGKTVSGTLGCLALQHPQFLTPNNPLTEMRTFTPLSPTDLLLFLQASPQPCPSPPYPQ
jgi:hypothetical protein